MPNGVPIDPAGTSRVTVNSFLADGGDNFSVLRDGTDRLGGEVDLDVLVTYFGCRRNGLAGPAGPDHGRAPNRLVGPTVRRVHACDGGARYRPGPAGRVRIVPGRAAGVTTCGCARMCEDDAP